MGEPEPSPTERGDLAGLVGDIEHLEALFAGWDEGQRLAVEAYRRSIEALHGEALRRLVRGLKGSPAALAALKAVAGDEVVYAVLRRHEIVRASLAERVERALAAVRPMLASHGGDVDLVAIEPPRVAVRFTGACDGCPSSAMTFHAGVKQAIEDACPEITEVVQSSAGRHAAAATGSGGPGPGEASPAVALVSPFSLLRGGGWQAALELAAIPEGGVVAARVGGESVLLSRRGARVSCFANSCAHLGMPLDGGEVVEGTLCCPHHGFRYDLQTGECLTAPTVALSALPVRVVGAQVQVQVRAPAASASVSAG
jgi:nitrite reductase/ring-hydroxylating ferredoxin subunit/Fe-S cluster biogenesis protein NfuA